MNFIWVKTFNAYTHGHSPISYVPLYIEEGELEEDVLREFKECQCDYNEYVETFMYCHAEIVNQCDIPEEILKKIICKMKNRMLHIKDTLELISNDST